MKGVFVGKGADKDTIKSMIEYFGISKHKLKKLEENNPGKFLLMQEEVLNASVVDEVSDEVEHDVIVIAVLGTKGGVGKSTISNLVGSYFDDTVVFNIDLDQEAEEVNSCSTVDYVKYRERGVSIEAAFAEITRHYRIVIIDTPGSITEELVALSEMISYFIVPFNPGPRSISTTIKMLDSYFGGADAIFSGERHFVFILNQFTNKNKIQEDISEFKGRLQSLAFEDLEIIPKYLGLPHSDTVITMEKHKKSIDELSSENRVAYITAQKRIQFVCENIAKHFNLDGE